MQNPGENEFLTGILQTKRNLIMMQSVDTDPLVVLDTKPLMMLDAKPLMVLHAKR